MQLAICKTKPFSKLYSALVALLPIFASYASGIPGFSMADGILIICCLISILSGNKIKRNKFIVRPTLIAVALYLIVFFDLLTVVFQQRPEITNIFIRTIRYFFYLFVVAACSIKYFDLTVGQQYVKCICFFATCYIIIQYLTYSVFSLILPGYLPFIDLYVDYSSTDYAALYAVMFRPTSFFLEPAHYARYMLIGVVFCLFYGENVVKKQILLAVFISIGILISTSAQGYVLLAMEWLLFLLFRIKNIKSRKLRMTIYTIVALLPLMLMGIMQFSFVQKTLFRALNIDVSNLANENTAFGARLGGFLYYLELDPIYQFIGKGFGVVPEKGWLSSAAYWLYGSGIIVFVLYLFYAVKVLTRSTGSSRIIALLFLILFFTDDSFYSYMCVLFISISCIQPVRSEKIEVPVYCN